MADEVKIDPRDYQGIESAILNVVRSVLNQIAIFVLSYDEILDLIDEIRKNGLLTEVEEEKSTVYKSLLRKMHDFGFNSFNEADENTVRNRLRDLETEMSGARKNIKQGTDDVAKRAKSILLKSYLLSFSLATPLRDFDFFTNELNEGERKMVQNLILKNINHQDIVTNLINLAKEAVSFSEESATPQTTDTKPDDQDVENNQSKKDNTTDTSTEPPTAGANPNYNNEDLKSKLQPLVNKFRSMSESKLIFEEEAGLKTKAKNAYERWTNSLLVTKIDELTEFLGKLEDQLEQIKKSNLDEPEDQILAYKWIQNVMGKTTEEVELNKVSSGTFKKFYNAFKKYNKELQNLYNQFKSTKPSLDDPSKIAEAIKKIIKEELKVLNGKKMVRN